MDSRLSLGRVYPVSKQAYSVSKIPSGAGKGSTVCNLKHPLHSSIYPLNYSAYLVNYSAYLVNYGAYLLELQRWITPIDMQLEKNNLSCFKQPIMDYFANGIQIDP